MKTNLIIFLIWASGYVVAYPLWKNYVKSNSGTYTERDRAFGLGICCFSWASVGVLGLLIGLSHIDIDSHKPAKW